MKGIILGVGLVFGLGAACLAADATPTVLFGGRGYDVTHESISVSSDTNSASIYPISTKYREFSFIDETLSTSNSYYYKMDGSTTSLTSEGMIFTTPYTLESSNPVAIIAPVGVSGRTLRVRIREK